MRFFFSLFVLWPKGFYCPEGSGYDLRGCPEGTYGPDPGYWSVSQCKLCDGGYYCSSRNGTAVTGPCQEGYYCSHGNISPQPSSRAAGRQALTLGVLVQLSGSVYECSEYRSWAAAWQKWFSISTLILWCLISASFVLCVSLQEREGHVLQAITAPWPPSIPCPARVEHSLTSPN